MLEDVDYLQLVPSVELLFADPIEIVDRNLRSWASAGDVECQDVFGQGCLHLDPRALWRTAEIPASWAERAQRLHYRAKSAPQRTNTAKLNYNEFTPMTKGP